MCHYCGCRDMPLLRDYIAEHERVINLGGAAVRPWTGTTVAGRASCSPR